MTEMARIGVFVAFQVTWVMIMAWSFVVGGAFQKPRSPSRLLIAGLLWTWCGLLLVARSAEFLL